MKTKLLITLLILPALAHAHPGHAGHEGDIGWSLAHPFTGFDHLLAALALGLWAGLHDRNSRWLPVAAFIGANAVGMIGGLMTGAFTGIETALAVTVVLFSASLAGGFRASAPLACGIAAACALIHGWAHGSEAPSSANMAAYCGGVLAGTLAICGTGLGMARLLRKRHILVARGIGALSTLIAAGMLLRSL